MSLNHRQKAFVLAYCKLGNATQAAIEAGYSQKTAHVQGCNLLKHPKVAEEIAKHENRIAEKVEIDGAWVLKQLAEEARQAKQDSARVAALNLLGKHFRLWDRQVEAIADIDWSRVSDDQLEELARAQQEGERSFRRALRELVN